MLVTPLSSASPAATASTVTAIVRFASPVTAGCRIAGLSAAARAVRAAAIAGFEECWLEVSGGWNPDPETRDDIMRLASGMAVHLGEALPPRVDVKMSGEYLAGGRDPAAHGAAFEGSAHGIGIQGEAFERAARRIVAATAKPGDGIVSRHINRPISQAISLRLLRIGWIRPHHATAGTALIALAMLASLLALPGQKGLIAGALLFQAASVFDGVDGEIARATFRTSEGGALVDSLVDAATNLAFVAGVVAHLWLGGHRIPATFGVAGLAMLALGLTIIGRRARAEGGPFSFDGVKARVRASGSRIGLWLTWLTMRDFIALASVVLVAAGLAVPALVGFSVIMALWLVVVLAAGARQTA